MTSDSLGGTTWRWHDAATFGIEGKGWSDTKAPYHRLPARAEGVVRDVVWGLACQPSGLSVAFATDAPAVRARWTLGDPALAHPRMPASACSGLDLYAEDATGRLRWAGASREVKTQSPDEILLGDIVPGMHRYRLYLPLANPVGRLEVGVPEGATLEPISPRSAPPIVIYGTSICHGHCVSRPGMSHPSILGRRLGRPVVNLGFSGNAHMEPEIAELLAELEPAVYVLDPVPNMEAELIDERAEPFVRRLRGARPSTAIVMVEGRHYTDSWLCQGNRARDARRNAAFRAVYESLVGSGVEGLTYVWGERLYGTDGEASMDGSHPSDLGAVRMADALEPVLRSVLKTM